AAPRRGTETILVAEDDEQVRRLVESVLKEFGYEVIAASDGEEAVEKFRKHKEAIQLVILDVIMPRKNGRQAFEEIKMIKPGQKVIFTSGYTAEVVHQRGLLAEGIPFISKPVSPLALLEKMREILDAA
ncbi:MAG: response regulator, partial [Nitrospirota bacterium]|nr:response regulator [Nitrospirota bacterium]